MTLNKLFHYNSSLKIHIIIGFLLGILLGFILIILQPFNLNNFDHKYGNILLMGFGLIKFLNYVIAHLIEDAFYKTKKKWTLWYEIIFILFSSLSGAVIGYIYLDLVFENQPLSFLRLILFFCYIVLPILPLIIFPTLVLRYLFAKKESTYLNKKNSLIVEKPLEQLTLKGENIKDELIFVREQLIYVKSVDNYVQIYYDIDNLKSKMLRAKLSEILIQAPFLVKPHRSYLINPEHAFKVKGNSQKAVLVLRVIKEDIPISRISYKTIKVLFN